jgi:hypothetical protein
MTDKIMNQHHLDILAMTYRHLKTLKDSMKFPYQPQTTQYSKVSKCLK